MADHYRYDPTDPALRALLGRMYGETGMGAATQAEKNVAEIQSLLTEKIANAIDSHAAELQAATVNLKRGLATHAKSLDEDTKKILDGMKGHAEALTNAAAASDTNAKSLVGVTRCLAWATGALVLVAIVQVIVAWAR